MTRHYITAPRAHQVPVLYESMKRHCQPFALHVLAWDFEPPYDITAEGRQLLFTRRDKFLARHPELATLPGEPRSVTDAVCSVRWTFFAEIAQEAGNALAIDGDLWWWASPAELWREIDDAADRGATMAVSPHRFPLLQDGVPGVAHETHRRYGLYNGGLCWLSGEGTAAEEMAERTRDWCRGEIHPTHGYGDQGHLEEVAGRHVAHVIQHPGVNVGPWNINGLRLEAGSPPRVNGHPIVAYHYSSMTPDRLAFPEYAITREQARILYAPYQEALRHAVG